MTKNSKASPATTRSAKNENPPKTVSVYNQTKNKHIRNAKQTTKVLKKQSKTGDRASSKGLVSNKKWGLWEAEHKSVDVKQIAHSKSEKERKRKVILSSSDDDSDGGRLFKIEPKPFQICVGVVIQVTEHFYRHPDPKNIRVGQVTEILLSKEDYGDISTELVAPGCGEVVDLTMVKILARQNKGSNKWNISPHGDYSATLDSYHAFASKLAGEKVLTEKK